MDLLYSQALTTIVNQGRLSHVMKYYLFFTFITFFCPDIRLCNMGNRQKKKKSIKKKKRVMKCGPTKKESHWERPKIANQRKRKTENGYINWAWRTKTTREQKLFYCWGTSSIWDYYNFAKFYFPPHLQAMAHEIPAWNFELVGWFEREPVLHTSVRNPCGHICHC